jgi:hypothetical protein
MTAVLSTASQVCHQPLADAACDAAAVLLGDHLCIMQSKPCWQCGCWMNIHPHEVIVTVISNDYIGTGRRMQASKAGETFPAWLTRSRDCSQSLSG